MAFPYQKINWVRITNPDGQSHKMILTNPERSGGLAIFRIEGLGPANATINTTDLAVGDGAFFNSARIQKRNITLTIKPMFAPTVEDARLLVYRFFPTGRRIKLEFQTRNRLVETYGFVETNTPEIFSKQQTIQISVVCPDPFFYALGMGHSVFTGVQPMFEFPFSNESLTEDLLIMGDIVFDNRADVLYEGDADTGITITVTMLGPLLGGTIQIFNVLTQETMTINASRVTAITGQQLALNDQIIITTTRGRRGVQLLRQGIFYNIIGALDRGANWFQLTPGDNVFTFDTSNEADALIMRFDYQIAFRGI